MVRKRKVNMKNLYDYSNLKYDTKNISSIIKGTNEENDASYSKQQYNFTNIEKNISGFIQNAEEENDEGYHVKIASVPLWYYTFVCVCLASLGINGIILNGLVIRSFIIRPSIRTPYNLIVLNLAFVELLLASVGVPADVQALIYRGWTLGKISCAMNGMLVTTCGFTSMFTLCALSVCRYGRIFHGNITETVSSFHVATAIICFVWLYSLCLSIPPLFGWGRYVPELSGLGCAPDWHSSKKSKPYILFILVFGFVMPTTVIIISSFLTCFDANQQSFPTNQFKNRFAIVKQHKKDFQLVIAMNVAFLICWSPYASMCMIHTFVSTKMIGPMLSMIPTLTVKISVCINPILYIAYNPQFIGDFPQIRKRKRKRQPRIKLSRQKKFEECHDFQMIDFNLPCLRTILREIVQVDES